VKLNLTPSHTAQTSVILCVPSDFLFYLSLLTNAIRYSAPLGPHSAAALYGLPLAPSTDTATPPLPLLVLPARPHFAAANGHTNAVRALELPLLGFFYRPALRAHQINSNGIGDVVKGWE
jgi:hypothetical protein